MIFMPGDRIIREREKGTEMFFISEGIAEIVIRKTSPSSITKQPSGGKKGTLSADSSPDNASKNKPPAPASVLKFHKKKGDYFGEV